MGLFRFIVQGIGWEIGRSAAREGIDSLNKPENDDEQPALPPTKKELAALEKQRRLAEAERIKTIERKQAEIEAELARLKKQK